MVGGDWTLFALESASGESAGQSLLERIGALARDLGDRWFVSPLFGPRGARSVLNVKIIVGFEEDEVPAFAEKVLLDAGLEIRERDFARMKNVFRGVLRGARSGLDVLRVANSLAVLDFVRWSEPGFTELSAPAACVGLATPPTAAELDNSDALL